MATEIVLLDQITGSDGWVGVGSMGCGFVLCLVALFRRARATLAQQRRERPESAAVPPSR